MYSTSFLLYTFHVLIQIFLITAVFILTYLTISQVLDILFLIFYFYK